MHRYRLEAVVRPSRRFRWTDHYPQSRNIVNAHFRYGLLSLSFSPVDLDGYQTVVFDACFDDATSVLMVMSERR